MTKTRKQRRAEAVERLRKMLGGNATYNGGVMCALAYDGDVDAYKAGTMDEDIRAIIDLLSEDECRPVEQYLDSHSDLSVTVCSSCGVHTDDLEDCYFCPNCGARVKSRSVISDTPLPDAEQENRRSHDGGEDTNVISGPPKVTLADSGGDLQSQVPVPNETGNETRSETRSDTDTRKKLEADLCELVLKWYVYDGNYMRCYASVAYAHIKAMLDRQAAITERETRDHMRDATADMVDEMWGTYQIVDGAYNFAIAKVDKLLDKMGKMRERHRAEIDHMREATGEMVKELWFGFEMMHNYTNETQRVLDERERKLDATREALREAEYELQTKWWKRRAKGRG